MCSDCDTCDTCGERFSTRGQHTCRPPRPDGRCHWDYGWSGRCSEVAADLFCIAHGGKPGPSLGPELDILNPFGDPDDGEAFDLEDVEEENSDEEEEGFIEMARRDFHEKRKKSSLSMENIGLTDEALKQFPTDFLEKEIKRRKELQKNDRRNRAIRPLDNYGDAEKVTRFEKIYAAAEKILKRTEAGEEDKDDDHDLFEMVMLNTVGRSYEAFWEYFNDPDPPDEDDE